MAQIRCSSSIGLVLIALFCASASIGVLAAPPGQVHISVTGDNTQMLINYVSDSAKDAATVSYGKTKVPDSTWQTTSGNTTSYSFEGYTSGGLHSVLLRGLVPSTVYYYQVGGDNGFTYHFKAAPPVGTSPVVFGAIGDVGADDNSNNTIQGLIRERDTEGIDLIIHAGDLSYANNYNPGGPVWDRYGQILAPLAAYTPYEPSVGNHETIDDFTGFRLRYDTSQLEQNSKGGNFFWSIDYGFVHFIMLSSETDYSHSSDQRKWLENDLKKVNRQTTPWVVASWHRPWYNSNKAHQGEGEKMRVSLEPLFYQYKVDLALVGHVHAYERVAPVYDNKENAAGTAYVTLGNGGTPEGLAKDWESKPSWSQVRIAEWGFSRLEVVNATHAHLTLRLNSDYSIRDDHWFIRKSNF